MSQTLTLTGVGNLISVDYFPAIELSPDYNYVMGLVGFYGCNSVRNIYEGNNKFYYGNSVVTIPTGAYEIDELSSFLKSKIPTGFELKANNNTLKCEILASHEIDFRKEGNIGRMLGFSKKKLKANVKYDSDLGVQIIKATNIQVDCSITVGAYRNSASSHTIFEFDTFL